VPSHCCQFALPSLGVVQIAKAVVGTREGDPYRLGPRVSLVGRVSLGTKRTP
jgi:hypothetical protein